MATLDPESKEYQDYIEGLVRSAQGWCGEIVNGKPEKCDASTPEGALNWLAGYSQSAASRYWLYKSGVSLENVYSIKDKTHPFDMALEIAEAIKNPGEWTGWAANRPFGVGNAYLFGGMDDPRLRKALDLDLAEQVLGGDNPVIIPTGCGSFYLYNNQKDWDKNGCGSWPGNH